MKCYGLCSTFSLCYYLILSTCYITHTYSDFNVEFILLHILDYTLVIVKIV